MEEEVSVNDAGEVIRAKTMKRYPPDVKAAIFWLKNRRPAAWREGLTSEEIFALVRETPPEDWSDQLH